jgi:hypothetical protein
MKYYIWASDISKNTGEGNLARLFIEHQKLDIQNISITKFKSKIVKYKYILPFIGIIYCWYFFLKKKKIYYLNYLPLWNFLIFLLLPPKTILGPITGGANFNSSVIRKYIFPILYSISQIIIYFRFSHIYFSTSLLKDNLFYFLKKKSSFDFILFALNAKEKKRKKNIDFLIYYRNHPNKKSFFPYFFIKNLIMQNFKVYIIGDKLNIKGLRNLGKLTNKKVNEYLSRTRFSIPSGENLLSFFTIECINNNVKILVDKQQIPKTKILKNKLINVNYNSDNLKSVLRYRSTV